MKRPLYFALFVLLVGCSKVDTPVPEPSTDPDFSPPASMSTEFDDEARDVAVTPNGAALVVGFTRGDNSSDYVDFWFMRRYSAEGELKWEQRVDRCKNPPLVIGPIEPGSLENCADWGVAVATDVIGNAYVLSQTRATHNYGDEVVTAYLSKYAVDGTRLWDKQVAESRSGEKGESGQLITDFTVGSDGSAYLIAPGVVSSTKVNQNSVLLKYGADGEKLWEKPGGLPDTDKVAVSSNSLYTAGVTDNVTDNDTDNETTELRRLTTDGETLWERTISNSGYSGFASLAVTGEAYVYVVTGVNEASRMYYDGTATIAKFDGKGNLVWSKTLAPEPHWGVNEVAADTRGRLYIVGTAETEELVTYGYALRYSPEGVQDWVAPLKVVGEREVLDTITYPLGAATMMTTDSYGDPQTRLYIAGYSQGSTVGGDAFLVSANDRSDEEDQGSEYPNDLEAYWLKN